MLDFAHKLPPFYHQDRDFQRSRDMPLFAVFWEQGTGKTKLILDTAAWLYLKGEIDAVIIVAPNSVHRNWVEDEIPEHLMDEVAARSRFHIYQAVKAQTKWHQAAIAETIRHPGLAWLAISYNAFMTKRGKQTIWKMLKKRRCLYVLDESSRVKTPGAKRTKSIVASGRYAKYKRILTGTPVSNGPFDVYSQVRFLDEDYWLPHSIGSALAFRHQFGQYEDEKGYNAKTGKEYDVFVDYKNLDQLYRWLQPISSRVLKSQVLDLPPKLYSRRYFEMNSEQKRVYDQLKEEFIAELESGDTVKAPLILTRMLRLQQVTCGYLPVPSEDFDEDYDFHLLGDDNPRLELIQELAEDTPHQAIIWARFTKDVDLIMEALGDNAVRYDGKVSEEQRAVNKQRFLKGEDRQFFVGKPTVGGVGLTLTCAQSVLYYNNSFSLEDRLQSEDRAHRITQEHPVNYIDIMAQGTIDVHIARSLVRKFNVASQVTGDEVRKWL